MLAGGVCVLGLMVLATGCNGSRTYGNEINNYYGDKATGPASPALSPFTGNVAVAKAGNDGAFTRTTYKVKHYTVME